jgi:hypothetical protein
MDQGDASSSDTAEAAMQAAKWLRKLRSTIPDGWQTEAAERLGTNRVRLNYILNGASVLERVAADATPPQEYEE